MGNKLDQLSKLAELKEKGILSEEEYQNEKAKIMNDDSAKSVSQPVPPSPIVQPKKKKGWLVCLIVFAVIAAIFGSQIPKISEAANSANIEVIFDATKFIVDEKIVSENQLIDMLGKPDKIEKWNYETTSGTYPIRTLIYGNYEYHFNADVLQRISINEEIPFKNKNEILQMFGLKKYANSSVKDTNFAYRVKNCGVYDFWTQYSDGKLSFIKISYGPLFGG